MKNSVLSIVFALLVLSLLSGCRLGKSSGPTTTDWSLPTVKLPTAKKEDIKNPADRADPKATSELAHQRVDGRNPAVPVKKDDALAPNAREVANLNRFDEQGVPSWAQGSKSKSTDRLALSSPSSPETSNAVPAEAGDLRLPDLNSESPVASATASQPAADPFSSTSSELSSSLPPLPSSPQSADVAESALPPLDSSLPPLGAALPQTASSTPSTPIEATPAPQTGNQPAIGQSLPTTQTAPTANAGSASSMAPGTSTASVPSNASGTTSRTSTGTTSSTSTPAANSTDSQPPVLFLPGNINPSYPNM